MILGLGLSVASIIGKPIVSTTLTYLLYENNDNVTAESGDQIIFE